MPANDNTVAPKPERLLSLDAFRGATLLAMVAVNNPGTWGAMYAPLAHAEWHGWTPTDLIFPWFVFIMGTAVAIAMKKYSGGDAKPQAAVYGRIAKRTVVLFALGLLLAASGGIYYALAGDFSHLSLANLRIPGVLQRLALAYLAVSLLALHFGWRGQLAVAVLILAGYATLLYYHPNHDDHVGNLSPTGNMVRVVDLATIGPNHMYTRATDEPTDPEGFLSTFPAIVTALLGYWTGLAIDRWPRSMATVAKLALIGGVLYVIGEYWHTLGMPVNKKLWTSSFVLVTGGLAMAAFAGCYALFDLFGARKLAMPLAIVGLNPITVFVGSGLLARLLTVIKVGSGDGAITLQAWLYQHLFTSWLAEPKMASLGFSLATVAFWWLVAWLMWRRGWVLRV
jgi:predicted acyltransferase